MSDFNQLFESIRLVELASTDVQLVEMLQEVWRDISADYCRSILSNRLCTENISLNDIARVEITADEVRSAVYCQVLQEREFKPQLLESWFDLSISKQDRLLKEAFPSDRVYGV